MITAIVNILNECSASSAMNIPVVTRIHALLHIACKFIATTRKAYLLTVSNSYGSVFVTKYSCNMFGKTLNVVV